MMSKMTAAPSTRRRPLAPFALSETDEELLETLSRYQFLAVNQWARHFEDAGRIRYLQRRTHQLREREYLLQLSLTRGRGEGKGEYLFTHDARGRHFCEEKGLPVPQRFRPVEIRELSVSQRWHTKAISDVLLAFDLLAKHNDRIRIEELLHERYLHERRFKVDVPELNKRTGQTELLPAFVVPDAYVQVVARIGNKGRRIPLVVEVDADSEYQVAFRRKIRRLFTFGENEEYKRVYGVGSYQIAFFVFSPRRDPARRLASLLNYTEAELQALNMANYARRIGFCALDPATTTPEELLLAPVWRHPFTDTRSPLLDLRVEGGA
jgi:protein involved in plasmid replication-relaxation